MSNKSTEAQISARVDAFVADLTGLIRQAALEAVQDALSGTTTTRVAKAKPAAATTATTGTRKKRRKRGKGTLIPMDRVFAAIEANPGTRTEVIAKGFGTDSKALKPAIDELIATKKIVRKGKARGATLHVGR